MKLESSMITQRSIKRLRLVLWTGIVFFVLALLQAMIQGSFFGEFRQIFQMPWGVLALVDLYLGLALFALFIWFTEVRKAIALLWIIGLVCFGNLVSLVYLVAWTGKSIETAGVEHEE